MAFYQYSRPGSGTLGVFRAREDFLFDIRIIRAVEYCSTRRVERGWKSGSLLMKERRTVDFVNTLVHKQIVRVLDIDIEPFSYLLSLDKIDRGLTKR